MAEPKPCDVIAGLADGLRATARELRGSADALERRAAKMEAVAKEIEPERGEE